MGIFVVGCLLGVIALIGVVVAIGGRDDEGMLVGGAVTAIVAGLLSGGLIIADSHVSVDANTVAIIQEFGKPVGDPAGPGWNWTAPWATASVIDTKVQTTARLAGDKGDTPGADCVKVNFKDNASACADITISYRVSSENAVKLWRNYSSLDDARDKLLRPATDSAAREVYGSFTSLDVIDGSKQSAITDGITSSLRAKLASSGLDLVSVAPGQIHLSDSAQANLDKLRNAQVETQVAQQTLAKNQALAAANNALNASLTDGIKFEDCLNVARDIKTVGFSCTGSGSNMLLNVSGSNK
jgi:regulator of protease activity HflC (stomatin/prohibitin superfamily)